MIECKGMLLCQIQLALRMLFEICNAGGQEFNGFNDFQRMLNEFLGLVWWFHGFGGSLSSTGCADSMGPWGLTGLVSSTDLAGPIGSLRSMGTWVQLALLALLVRWVRRPGSLIRRGECFAPFVRNIARLLQVHSMGAPFGQMWAGWVFVCVAWTLSTPCFSNQKRCIQIIRLSDRNVSMQIHNTSNLFFRWLPNT